MCMHYDVARVQSVNPGTEMSVSTHPTYGGLPVAAYVPADRCTVLRRACRVAQRAGSRGAAGPTKPNFQNLLPRAHSGPLPSSPPPPAPPHREGLTISVLWRKCRTSARVSRLTVREGRRRLGETPGGCQLNCRKPPAAGHAGLALLPGVHAVCLALLNRQRSAVPSCFPRPRWGSSGAVTHRKSGA